MSLSIGLTRVYDAATYTRQESSRHRGRSERCTLVRILPAIAALTADGRTSHTVTDQQALADRRISGAAWRDDAPSSPRVRERRVQIELAPRNAATNSRNRHGETEKRRRCAHARHAYRFAFAQSRSVPSHSLSGRAARRSVLAVSLASDPPRRLAPARYRAAALLVAPIAPRISFRIVISPFPSNVLEYLRYTDI